MQARDLIGYGPNPPAVEWPNDARIAVSFVLNYEEGSENSILDGDPHGETVGRIAVAGGPGRAGPGQRVTFFEYGSRWSVSGAHPGHAGRIRHRRDHLRVCAGPGAQPGGGAGDRCAAVTRSWATATVGKSTTR